MDGLSGRLVKVQGIVSFFVVRKARVLYRAANVFQDCLQGFALVTLLVVLVITPLSKAVLGRVTESVHTTVVSDG